MLSAGDLVPSAQKRLKPSQTILPRCFPLGIPPHSLSTTHHEGPGDHVELLMKLQEVNHEEKEG